MTPGISVEHHMFHRMVAKRRTSYPPTRYGMYAWFTRCAAKPAAAGHADVQGQSSGGSRSSSGCTHPTLRRTIPPSVRPFTCRFGARGVISGSELTTLVTAAFGAEVVAGSSFSFSAVNGEVGLEQTFGEELPASCSSG